MKLLILCATLSTCVERFASTSAAGKRRVEGWKLSQCLKSTPAVFYKQCLYESANRCADAGIETTCGIDDLEGNGPQ